MNRHPRVGIAVFVRRENRFIMGLRRGQHGRDTWSLPGGHLEYAESFEHAAAREVMEETSVSIGSMKVIAITNDIFEESGRHYVTIWALADHVNGEPTTQEPDKFVNLRWVDLNEVPTPLFKPWQQLVSMMPIEHILDCSTVTTSDLAGRLG
jgi:8-oxo-dGTP diphosphatase